MAVPWKKPRSARRLHRRDGGGGTFLQGDMGPPIERCERATRVRDPRKRVVLGCGKGAPASERAGAGEAQDKVDNLGQRSCAAGTGVENLPRNARGLARNFDEQ